VRKVQQVLVLKVPQVLVLKVLQALRELAAVKAQPVKMALQSTSLDQSAQWVPTHKQP
jgi:hypothetical protein